MKLDYVRGHMGGNLIILLRGDQIPVGRELEISKIIMSSEYLSEFSHSRVEIASPGKTRL